MKVDGKGDRENSNFIRDGLEFIFFAHDEIVKRGQLSLDKFVETFSDKIDSFVIKVQKEEGIKLVSGNVSLCISDDGVGCYLDIELYFLNGQKVWVKKSNRTDIFPIEWVLIPCDQDLLRKSRKIEYPYDL